MANGIVFIIQESMQPVSRLLMKATELLLT